MSFILEALRKSESERRMESAPQVMRIPLAVTRQRLPGWAIALIVSLVVAVAGLAAVSWRQILAPALEARSAADRAPASLIERHDPASPRLEQPPTPEAVVLQDQAVVAVDPPAPAAASEARQPEDAAPSDSAASAPMSTAQNEPTPATTPRVAAAVSAPPAAPPEPSAASLPSLAALRAEGFAVPALDLQLHVYSPNRAGRFVLVNGTRYGEGQEIAPGAMLVGIAREGAVVRFNGREFLLTAN
jgi:general secretion pathway protein B